MEIAEVDSIAAFSSHNYNKIPIIGTKGLLRLLCFEPNQNVPLHKHPRGDKCFLVIRGKGKIRIGNEETEAQSGTIIRAPANTPHQWKNGNEELIVLSVLISPSCYEFADETVKMEYT